MADNDYKIKVSIDADTQKALKTIDGLKSKIESIRNIDLSGVNKVLQGAVGGVDLKKLDSFKQSILQQQQKMNQQTLSAEEGKLKRWLDVYEKINAKAKTLNTETKQYEEAMSRISKVSERIAQQSSIVASVQKNLPSGGGNGTGGTGGTDGTGGTGGTGGIKPAALLAAAGKASNIYGQYKYQEAVRPIERAKTQAGIVDRLSEYEKMASERRGYEYFLYAPERSEAMKRFGTIKSGIETKDKSDLMSHVLFGAAAGAGYAGKVGLYGGGLFGLGIGAAGGGIVGGALALANYRTRSMVTNPEDYSQMTTKESLMKINDEIEAKKQIDYQRDMAGKYFAKNAQNFISTQRQFGMSDQDLFLGKNSLLRKGAEAGFFKETIQQQMQDILSGGGTTAVSKEGAISTAELARDMNLTNAGRLMGRISGSTGMNAQQSKDEIIRMYAQATRIGLDSSKFSEETRQFLTVSADMAYKFGGGAERTAEMLGFGMGDKLSQRGIEAAQNAMQAMKQLTGGGGGQLADQVFMASAAEKFGLDTGNKQDMNILGALQFTDIQEIEDSAAFRQLTKKKGYEKGSKEYQTLLSDLTKEKAKSLGMSKDTLDLMTGADSSKQENVDALITALNTEMGPSFGNLPAEEQDSFAKMLMKMSRGSGGKTSNQEVSDAVKTATEKTKSRMGDKYEKQGAQGDIMNLDRLSDNADKLSDSFDAVTSKGLALAGVFEELMKLIKNNKDITDAQLEKARKQLMGEEITPPEPKKMAGKDWKTYGPRY